MHYRIYLFLALLGIFHQIKSERNIVHGRQNRCELLHRSTISGDRSHVFEDSRKLCPEVVIQRNQRRQISSRYRDQTDLRLLQRNIRENRQSRTPNYDRIMFARNTERNEPERIGTDFQRTDERHNLVPRARKVDKPLERAFLRSTSVQRKNDGLRNHIQSKSIDRMRQNERRISRHRSLDRSNSAVRHDFYTVINTENRPSQDMRRVKRHIAERRTISQTDRRDLSRIAPIHQKGDDLMGERQLDTRRNGIDKRVVSERDSRLKPTSIENLGRSPYDTRLSLRDEFRKKLNLNTFSQGIRNVRHQITDRTILRSYSNDMSRITPFPYYGEDLLGERQSNQRKNIIDKRSVLLNRESRFRQTDKLGRVTRDQRLSQRSEFRKERSVVELRERYVTIEREIRDNRIEFKSSVRPKMRSFVRTYSITRNLDNDRSAILRRERTTMKDLNNSQGLQKQSLITDNEMKDYSVKVRHMERDIIGLQLRDNNAETYRRVDARQAEGRNKKSSTRISHERDNQRIDRERYSRSELARNPQRILRDAPKVAVPRERNSRENSENRLRYEFSRNTFNSFKSNDISPSSHWQVLIYTLQGIYMCSLLFNMLFKCKNSVKKPRFYGWFTVADPMKID